MRRNLRDDSWEQDLHMCTTHNPTSTKRKTDTKTSDIKSDCMVINSDSNCNSYSKSNGSGNSYTVAGRIIGIVLVMAIAIFGRLEPARSACVLILPPWPPQGPC